MPELLRKLRHASARRTLVLLGLLIAAALGYRLIRPIIVSELSWRAMRQRGALRVGIDPGQRPFSFYDDAGWQGLDAELARELGKRLNLQMPSDPVGYDSMYDALQTQRTDLGLSALVIDPSRTQDIAYTEAYFDAGVQLIAPMQVREIGDLAGQRVAVSLGSEADRQVRYWARRLPHLVRIETNDDEAAIDLLNTGKADVAAVDGVRAKTLLQRADPARGHWQVLPFAPRGYVIAVRREDARLLRELNTALAEMKRDGTLDRLSRAVK